MERHERRSASSQSVVPRWADWRLTKGQYQYLRLGFMVAASTAAMYGLTYTNSYSWDHIRWSEERLYMALLMGSAMAVIMLGFMWNMLGNARLNIGLMAFAVVLGCTALWLSRSQALVGDQDYMKGMIPHHSIAILTSDRADIQDARVRKLADEIISSQEREIKEMDWLLGDISKNGLAKSEEDARQRPVPDFGSTQ